eukprot:scaffold26625_cov15-Tisochrysis_lutea.AAC.1
MPKNLHAPQVPILGTFVVCDVSRKIRVQGFLVVGSAILVVEWEPDVLLKTAVQSICVKGIALRLRGSHRALRFACCGYFDPAGAEHEEEVGKPEGSRGKKNGTKWLAICQLKRDKGGIVVLPMLHGTG